MYNILLTGTASLVPLCSQQWIRVLRFLMLMSYLFSLVIGMRKNRVMDHPVRKLVMNPSLEWMIEEEESTQLLM